MNIYTNIDAFYTLYVCIKMVLPSNFERYLPLLFGLFRARHNKVIIWNNMI